MRIFLGALLCATAFGAAGCAPDAQDIVFADGGSTASGSGAAPTGSATASSAGASSSSGIGGHGDAGTDAPTCAHDKCTAGVALDPSCNDPCVAKVCAEDPSCCGALGWNIGCLADVQSLCGALSCLPVTTCAHTPCTVGDPLPGGDGDACDLAVYKVCNPGDANLPACCTDAWTQDCVDAAAQQGVCP